MANQLEIPILNWLHFVPVNPNTPAQYNTRYFDDYLFEDTFYEFQETKNFFLPVQNNDIRPFQFTSNFNPIQLDLINSKGKTVFTVNASPVRANKYQPGFYVYEATINFATYPEDGYRFLLTPGGDSSAQLKSQWFFISTLCNNTVLIEYFNSRFHGDVIFETGIKFALRVPGFIEWMAPGSQDQLYRDQEFNQSQLSSKPFRAMKFYVGDGSGVPPWLIDKINYAFGCNNVSIDGKLVAKQDGTKWTEFAQEDSPVKGYAIDLFEGLNRASKIINPGIDPNKKIAFSYQVDQSVFGDVSNTAGSIVIPITGDI